MSLEPGLDLASLALRLQERALALGVTVGTAESCTGGLIGHALTAIPGSSDYYRGGVISYSNELKRDLLGVSAETLKASGAVSEEVAASMALGARERLAVDWSVAVTGIAGPAGGTSEKPVGLTYVAAAGPGGLAVRRHVWDGDRTANKERSATAALALLLELLVGGRA